MTHVLIVGAGLAGCAAAQELAEHGVRVTVIESADKVGGKVRSYGCKATDKCNNCGVCITVGLWEKVEQSEHIAVMLGVRLIDLAGTGSGYTATVRGAGGVETIAGIDRVVIATGFSPSTLQSFNGFVELGDTRGIVTGSQLETMLQDRTESGFLPKAPSGVAFIQCYGSRDEHEHTMYCSKVCCSYATRAAKVLKHFYPDCRVVLYYMELQMVGQGDYYQSLLDAGIEFVKCRPVDVRGGDPATVTFDNPRTGRRETDAFDMVVLSDGIRPDEGARQMAELCGLRQDESGFLHYVGAEELAGAGGVYLSGCVKGPRKIEETYAETIAVAREILATQEVPV